MSGLILPNNPNKPYKDYFKAEKTFIGVPESGGFRGPCDGAPLRLDSDDEGYKMWYGIPSCVKTEWRYRLALVKKGTTQRAMISTTEISSVHVHPLSNGLIRHIIHLNRYPERGLAATFWKGEPRAKYYPRYELAREFPELLKQRVIVMDARKDFTTTFFILQSEANRLVNHLINSTGNPDWRDSFSVCYGGSSHKVDNSISAVMDGSATPGDDGVGHGTGVSEPGMIEGENRSVNGDPTKVNPNWTIVNEAGRGNYLFFLFGRFTKCDF